ncbi:MAG: twin transmembrane helix small protein [Ottowia sp.]|jgi:hypothetical protein|nr:twin transmembrane helix small protein [Ottowia sp.]
MRLELIVAIVFVVIIASLGWALFYLMTDKGKSNRTVHALMLRVGLSIGLFLFILLAYRLGWVNSTGIPLH